MKFKNKIFLMSILVMFAATGCSGKNGSTGVTGPTGTTGQTGPVTSAPVISGLDPTMASFNTVITITGENFTASPTVSCDGSPAMVISSSGTQITATGCGIQNPSQPYQAAVNVLIDKQTSNAVNENIVPSGYIWQFPAAALTGPEGAVYDSTAGKLYVADNAGVFAVDNASGWTTKIVSAGCPSCTLSSPAGITMDNSGDLIVTDSSNNTLIGIDPTTGTTWYLLGPGNGLLNTPIGVTYAGSYLGSYLYVANSGSNAITQIDTSTLNAVNLTLNVALASSPYGITADGSGNLYVACRTNNTIAKVAVSGANGTVTNGYVTGIPSANGLSVSGTSLLATSNSSQALYSAPIGGGAASTMCADFSSWDPHSNSSIIPDGSGGIFVGDMADGLVYHVNSACSISTYAEGFGHPYDLTYYNGDFYVANMLFCDNSYGDAVLVVRPDGAMRVLAHVPGCNSSIVVNPAGGLTVGGWDGSVINVSMTGITTTVFPSGTISNGVGGIAYDPGDTLYVNDHSGPIYTWDGTTLSPFATDSGMLYKMIVNNGVLYITSAWLNNTIDSIAIPAGGTANVYLPQSTGLYTPESLGFDGLGNLIVEDYVDDGLFRVDAEKHVTVIVPRTTTTMIHPNGIGIPPSQLIYTVEEGSTTSRMWVIAP